MIGLRNSLSPVRHQTITEANAYVLSIRLLIQIQWNLNQMPTIPIKEMKFKLPCM